MKIPISKLLNNTGQIEGVPTNPRTIDKADYQKLLKSIQEDPEYLEHEMPHVIAHGDKYVVLNGNQRLRALRELKFTETPVTIYKPDTPPEVIRARIIKSNHGYGKDDFDMLANDVWSDDPLCEWGMDLPDDWLQDEQEVVEDEAPEVDESEPPKSKLGEVYQLGRHRVMCGDSTKQIDAEILMNEKKSELLFTSPPYSDMREYNGGKDLSVNNLTQFIVNFEPFCQYQAVNLGIQRKDNNINTYWDEYIEVAKKCGNKFLSWNVWVKPGAGSVGNQSAFFPIIHEWIFVFGHEFKDINRTEEKKTKEPRPNRKVRQKDGSMRTTSRGFMGEKKELESVIFANPELGEIRQEHPATFSVDLPSKYIKSITNKEDIVCDPFLGSGTTLIACEQTDRTCYGMELDPKYVDVIRKRYAKFISPDNQLPDNWQELTPTVEV